MAYQTQIHHISERVERLLLRYEELQRTNALLSQQVEVLTHERDSLKSRLSAARSRVDALLERLPENAHPHQPSTAAGAAAAAVSARAQ
ncbi:MAG: cell division protein ZapB [Chitinophagaceae bacterium]|nr:cell division protein ZapB [Polaromonas sp.]